MEWIRKEGRLALVAVLAVASMILLFDRWSGVEARETQHRELHERVEMLREDASRLAQPKKRSVAYETVDGEWRRAARVAHSAAPREIRIERALKHRENEGTRILEKPNCRGAICRVVVSHQDDSARRVFRANFGKTETLRFRQLLLANAEGDAMASVAYLGGVSED